MPTAPTRSPSPDPDVDSTMSKIALDLYDAGYEDGRKAGFEAGFRAAKRALEKQAPDSTEPTLLSDFP